MRKPVIGETCPALTNENYGTHLSGDCQQFCKCSITNNACFGRVIADKDDESSQFFSRAKCYISDEGLAKYPLFGASISTFELILKDRAEKELKDKLAKLKK